MKNPRRTFTSEFKQDAVLLVTRKGLSLSEAARRLGIHVNQLRNWKISLEKNGPPAIARQPTVLETENVRLRAENDRLRMEREILKKATAFFAKESR